MLLPRLASGHARAALLGNLAGLLATALTGAGLVHLLSYHVPFDLPFGPHWIPAAVALLLACPLLGPLGLVLAIAAAAVGLGLRELRRLERLNRVLARLLTIYADRPARHPIKASNEIAGSTGKAEAGAADEAVPRSPWRLLLFVTVLLIVQIVVLGLVDALYPMHMTMVMNDAPMTMAMTPVVPAWLLHLPVALVVGFALWRMEHRLTRLRRSTERRLGLLRAAGHERRAPVPIPVTLSLPCPWSGHALFARPPPVVAAR